MHKINSSPTAFFVVIEGPDGSGKSTLARMLAATVEMNGHLVAHTFEPTNRKPGLRAIKEGRAGNMAEAMEAFTEDRRLHLRFNIGPALELGSLVICERYALSTAIYQGGEDWLRVYREQLQLFRVPDLTIVVSAPMEMLLERRARLDASKGDDGRSGGAFDDESAWQERRLRYLEAANTLDRFVLIENDGAINDTLAKMSAVISKVSGKDYSERRKWLKPPQSTW